jgi:hypothetical protein
LEEIDSAARDRGNPLSGQRASNAASRWRKTPANAGAAILGGLSAKFEVTWCFDPRIGSFTQERNENYSDQEPMRTGGTRRELADASLHALCCATSVASSGPNGCSGTPMAASAEVDRQEWVVAPVRAEAPAGGSTAYS